MKTILVVLALLLQSSVVWAADLRSATTSVTSATVHTTCATDLICGLATPMRLGDASLQWSDHSEDSGYLYCNDGWEFAPCAAKTLEGLFPAEVFAADFVGKEDEKGPQAFGEKWHEGSLLVSAGDILFARRKDAPGVAYAMKIDQNVNWRVWVRYRVADKGDATGPRWSSAAGFVEENEKDVLGNKVLLSPEQARTALVKMLLAEDAKSPLAELARTGEIVTIRRGLILIQKKVRCDLEKTTFYCEVGSGDFFLQIHKGVFRQEGQEWQASTTTTTYLDR